MKRTIMAVLAVMTAAGLYAQNTFFAEKKGMVLTYAALDDKGKNSGFSALTIKDVKGSGGNMTITYGVAVLDKDRKPLKNAGGEQTFQVVVKNNVVFLDNNQFGSQFLTPEVKAAGMKMDVSGTPIELPKPDSLKPGDKIKDAEIIISIDMGMVKMKTVSKMTDGKCLVIENVKVPAGTFKCHKVTQKITTTAMNKTTVETNVNWYAPGIGTVKSETYDAKNKLQSSSELVELKGK